MNSREGDLMMRRVISVGILSLGLLFIGSISLDATEPAIGRLTYVKEGAIGGFT